MVNTKWKEVSVKDLMKIETGSRNTEDKIDDGQYPFFVRSQTVEHIDSFHYDCEAVLTAGDGVGTGKVFHYINGKFDAHQRVYVMSQFKDVLGKYFYYWFSKNFFAEVAKYTAKSSVDSVRRQMIAGMVLPLPSAEEQQKIVGILSDIDTLITNLQKLIQKKKDIRQGTMQMLVTGKKRLDGFSGNWITKPLEKLCDLITDGSHESPSEYLDGFYMPSVKDMTDSGFDFSDCKRISKADYERLVANGCKPEIGDVLIAKDGSMLKYVFPVKENRNIVILSSIAILRPKKNMLSSSYLTYYFRQPRFVEQVIKSNQTGTGVPRIVLKNFKKIELHIPEKLNEQEAIAGILSDMDIDIWTLEKKLKKLTAIKQGMMEELLTGKVRLM